MRENVVHTVKFVSIGRAIQRLFTPDAVNISRPSFNLGHCSFFKLVSSAFDGRATLRMGEMKHCQSYLFGPLFALCAYLVVVELPCCWVLPTINLWPTWIFFISWFTFHLTKFTIHVNIPKYVGLCLPPLFLRWRFCAMFHRFGTDIFETAASSAWAVRLWSERRFCLHQKFFLSSTSWLFVRNVEYTYRKPSIMAIDKVYNSWWPSMTFPFT